MKRKKSKDLTVGYIGIFMDLQFERKDFLITALSAAAAVASFFLIDLFMPGEADMSLALAFWIAFTLTAVFGRRYMDQSPA